MAKVSDLKQKRVALLSEARGILDKAEKEERSLSGEETQEYERISADLDSLDATIRVEEDIAERQRSIAKATEDTKEVRSENSDYSQVFDRYIRYGFNELDSEERSILRAGAGGETRTGGYLGSTGVGSFTVPTDFHNQLVNKLEEQSAVIAAGATILDTSGGGDILIPVVTAHSDTVELDAEGAGPTEGEDTFTQITLGAYKFAALVKCSVELLQDNAVNLEGYLANELGRKLGRKSGDYYAVGATGGTGPAGIFTAASVGATGATGLSADNLIDLVHSVTPPYRSSAAFLMNDSTTARLRKLKFTIGSDTVGYAWQPSMQAGTPDRLFGYPVYSEPSAVAVGATGARPIAFGDVSRFYVRRAGGVQFVRLNERYMDAMMVGFMAWLRTDSNLVDTNAVKVYENQGG